MISIEKYIDKRGAKNQMERNVKVSKAVLKRLPGYLAYLKSLPDSAPANISATALANALDMGEVQVRKDLAIVSDGGRPKVGYQREALIDDIEQFLGYDNTTDAVRALAQDLILISALVMPFQSFANATYFILRSGGQPYITFLFDCGFVWVVMVPLAYVLSRFVHMDILPLYFLCQSTNMLKALLGYTFLRQGKWIQNLTV